MYKKWAVNILISVLFAGCIGQEIIPNPDLNTRGCLLKEISSFSAAGGKWETSSQQFEYNQDGNPVKRIFFDFNRRITAIYTFDYVGTKLSKLSFYSGSEINVSNLQLVKNVEIRDDFLRMLMHNFRKTEDGKLAELDTYEYSFFRNGNGELKLEKVEKVGNKSTLDNVIERAGNYLRIEYDNDKRNVARLINKQDIDYTIFTLSGFDRNGKSPWNTNFWLSLTTDIANFQGMYGFWSENNLSLQTPGDNGTTLYYYTYELNSEGYPCISTQKLANNVIDQGESFFYYYNCECKTR